MQGFLNFNKQANISRSRWVVRLIFAWIEIFMEIWPCEPGMSKVLWNKNLPIFPERFELSCYFHVIRHPRQLQCNHRINLIGCGKGCSDMLKIFENNERIISSEIAEFRRVELYWILTCNLTSNQHFDQVILFECGHFFLSSSAMGKNREITPKNWSNGVVKVFKKIVN